MYEKIVKSMIKTFSINLKSTLEEYVKGSIYLEHRGDNLRVTIHNQSGEPFYYTIYNIVDKIVQGETAQHIAQDVVKQYKAHIIFVFFR